MKKITTIMAIAIFCCSAAILTFTHNRFILDTDDAYITYRYAANIAAGYGFVYNIGERILGTTTPLYTFLLAAMGLLQADIPTASTIINVLAGALAAALIFLLTTASAGSALAGLISVLLLLSYDNFVIYSIAGMETSLYIALIILTFYLYERRKIAAAFVISALVILTRMDGVAVVVAISLHYLFENRQLPPLRYVLVFLVPLIPWVVFAFGYFGNVLPHSMLAKHQHQIIASRWWMFEFLLQYKNLIFWPLIALGITLSFRKPKLPTGIVALIIWICIYVSAYTIYRIDLYRWYLSPIAIGLAVLPAFGFWRILTLMPERLAIVQRIYGNPNTLAIIIFLPFIAVNFYHLRAAIFDYVNWTQTVEQSRVDVAQRIIQDGSRDDVILTGAIGIVGWKTGLRIWDSMGLVTRNAVNKPFHEAIAESGARWIVTEIERNATAYPEVTGFKLTGSYNRGSAPITFLLYQHTGKDEEISTVSKREGNNSFISTIGISIMKIKVTSKDIRIWLTTDRTISRDYKFYIHRMSSDDPEKILAQYDFYPQPPTSRMKPGELYEMIHSFGEEVPAESLFKVGLFVEGDPKFPRLVDKTKRDGLMIKFERKPLR